MDIIQDLGDGLVLRRSTTNDIEALVTLQANAFTNPDTGEEDIYLGGWTRDLMGGKHPTFHSDDYFVVEDTKSGALVSCVGLISQTWTMEGIPFGVGRPEIVGTHSDWRKRGLVRQLFDALHQVSTARGELVQAISGILYFYRQFGYEYALDLDYARQTYIPQQIPELKAAEAEKFRLRHAEREDLDFVSEIYRRGAERSLLHCERDRACFEFEQFDERHPLNGSASWWDIIETSDGTRAGILGHRTYIYQGHHKVNAYELQPKFAWAEVTPFVLRELVRQGADGTLENEDGKPFSSLLFFLATNHPLFELMGESTAPFFDPYAWYLRVPDLPAFLARIMPLLEKRLAASDVFQKYSGTMHLNFFKSGLEMRFEQGCVKNIAVWQPHGFEPGHIGFGDATFPDLTFLKLLFGYRSRTEMQAMYPDCFSNSREIGALLDVLFPKKISYVVPLH